MYIATYDLILVTMAIPIFTVVNSNYGRKQVDSVHGHLLR